MIVALGWSGKDDCPRVKGTTRAMIGIGPPQMAEVTTPKFVEGWEGRTRREYNKAADQENPY